MNNIYTHALHLHNSAHISTQPVSPKINHVFIVRYSVRSLVVPSVDSRTLLLNLPLTNLNVLLFIRQAHLHRPQFISGLSAYILFYIIVVG